MRATCNREGLLTAFQVASSVVPARSPKPILRNVKLNVTDDGLAILMATDLELGIRYRVSGVTTEEPGQVILPTHEVVAILRELPDEVILIEQTDSGIRLTGSASKFELPSEDPLEYPEVPDLEEGKSYKIKASTLAMMIRRTVFAVATENSRYALNSVLVEFQDGKAVLVATDGKRLAVMPGPVTAEGTKPDVPTLIPPKALNLLGKVLQDPEEELDVALRENEALFRTGKVTIYTRLVEGRFPRYQDVFPKETPFAVPLVVGRFLGAIRQAKIVTSDESRGVDFRFADGTLTLESRAAELGQSEIRLPIAYDGDEIEITFDPQLLIDALRVLEPEEEVSLKMVDGRKAAVLKTMDEYSYVVMPLTRERDR